MKFHILMGAKTTQLMPLLMHLESLSLVCTHFIDIDNMKCNDRAWSSILPVHGFCVCAQSIRDGVTV